MRITKAILQAQNEQLMSRNRELADKNFLLQEKLELYDKLVKHPVTTLVVALEKVNDSTAHVASFMKELILRKV